MRAEERSKDKPGTETGRRTEKRSGRLSERSMAADEEDEQAGQDGGWATLLLSLLGFETC